MESGVPLIFSSDQLAPPMTWTARLISAGVALAALAALVAGAWLRPNGAEGISTHTQLGLPPCQFEQRMGIPCPSCGYTTSVSYFAHGNVMASAYLQPMGLVIGLFFAVAVWVGGYVAVTGKPVYHHLGRLPGRAWVLGVLTIAIAGWGWKIWIHSTGRDHWPL